MKYIGIIGLILVQGATALQIRKFIKTQETEGVSIGYWWSVMAGLIGYTIYACHINDWLFIIANAIGVVLCLITIVLYYKFTDRYFLP